MSVRSLALTAGIFGALTMFMLTWWLIFTDNAEGPPTILERIYIGYSFTPIGSVIGAVYGFVYKFKNGNMWRNYDIKKDMYRHKLQALLIRSNGKEINAYLFN